MLESFALRSGWTVCCLTGDPDKPDGVDGNLSAEVPGCVHLDLLRHGLIPDPYIDRNEPKVLWISRCDWRYDCRFNAPEALFERDMIELCFDGLDTVATITLNDTELGSVRNMHRRYRFDVKPLLRVGANLLRIDFRAPIPAAEEAERFYGALPHTGNGSNDVKVPHNMLRKEACSFGWDWGPSLASCGVWREARLEAWDIARLGDVRPIVNHVDEASAQVRVVTPVHAATDASTRPLRIITKWFDPGGSRIETHEVAHDPSAPESSIGAQIHEPRLWWPVGHGEQPLYRLEVELLDDSGATLDHCEHRVGLRTVELDTSPDPAPVPGFGQGSQMTLKVNGKPVYMKGANWIPDDCFPSRITSDEYRQRLAQARDANMNTIRIWGGGVFESDLFYDLCDELGLMVWQDFLFACAGYPEEEPYRSEVEAEARDNIARLAAHPSIVLFNGCNENIWAAFQWGDYFTSMRTKGERTWGAGYYLDLLPRLCQELTPDRPYWPGSPYSGSMDILPNADEHGNRHIWEVWHGEGNYRNYLEQFPRFASEFGYHGPMTLPTLERAIPSDQRWWHSEAMLRHNKNGRDGQVQTHERMGDDFDPPEDDFDAWLYLAQIMQARALETGCTWFRAIFPWCSGALYWQLNDCWPVSSWSAIDGDGRPKPLLHATRRFFAPRLATIKPATPVRPDEPQSSLQVVLHNDHDQPWEADALLQHVRPDGEILDAFTRTLRVPPREAMRFDVPENWQSDPDTALRVHTSESQGWWWFRPDKELHYATPAFEGELHATAAGYELSLTARSLLRDLCIFPDRLDPDAVISDQCLSLLPGETVRFQISTDHTMSLEQLTEPPVCRCANEFGAK